jgi:LAS superfamily LD-carboxypeptidase LdcB
MSAYRTYGDQAILFEYGCSLTRCAKIWGSEHQLWLAIDIHLARNKWYTKFSGEYLDRMNNHAYKYWFINTYRKWVDIDWKMNEVWHRRYIWIPFATTLFKKDMSFAQYHNLFYKISD